MKLSKVIILCCLMSSLVACSMRSKKKISEEPSVAVNTEETLEEDSDFVLEEEASSEADELVEDLKPAPTQEEAMTDSGIEEEIVSERSVAEESKDEMKSPEITAYGTYTVEKSDTLMLIAFKIYGDYAKWKDIKSLNPQIKGVMSLNVGDQLKYMEPTEKFVYSPKGNPILVKKGDTLGSISSDVYGVMKRWRDIYENNQPLIKDPNLIFAGFTLYYIPDGEKM